ARGSFQLRVVEEDDFGAPAPATQRVLLNFAATRSVRVQSRSPFDMPAFHGSILGAAFAPSTEMIKQMIVDRIRADYLGYNVEIFTSDDPELPAEPYSTIHFGGYDSALLGLADNVDQYNERPAQNAIIYVETFATFEYLEMTPEEIASMLANVASHELGHLLGLYHTRNPADVMDTTATAWELTENQGFVRAELEPSVFPVGFEDSPALLAQIVGTRPVTDADLKDRGTAKKIVVRSSIANAVRAQFGHGCGTCTECR
ncbi:MAG: matrixin family metalloprotease, partial [Phycisphaerae bacterium]